ncbi:MAG: RNA polymerase sigma factor [Cyclobacteriaceae bacterium]
MNELSTHIHHELIEQCLAGNSRAYERLYKLYHRSMYNTGFRIVLDEAEAEDVLQEAFVSAFRNLKHYRGDASFGSWLKRIVVNKAITHVSRKKAERWPEDDRFDIADVPEADVFDSFPYSVQQVRQAIELLPEGYRLVVSLYLLEGYDHAEIGEILGITESTSKSQFNRAKKKLKEILEGGKP